jgi:hypothetical protein
MEIFKNNPMGVALFTLLVIHALVSLAMIFVSIQLFHNRPEAVAWLVSLSVVLISLYLLFRI